MKTRFAFVVFVILTVCSCPVISRRCLAQDVPVVQETPTQVAYARVRNAPYFATGEVGFAGALPEEEKALQVLLQNKDALTLIEALLKDEVATREGKLYALKGLKVIESEQLKRDLSTFKARTMLPSDPVKPGSNAYNEALLALDAKSRAFALKVDRYFAPYTANTEATALVMRGCLVTSHSVPTIAQQIRGSGLLYPGPLKAAPISSRPKPAGARP